MVTAKLVCVSQRDVGQRSQSPGTGDTLEVLSAVRSGAIQRLALASCLAGLEELPAHALHTLTQPSRALGSLSEAGSEIFLVLMPHQDQGVTENRDVSELK